MLRLKRFALLGIGLLLLGACAEDEPEAPPEAEIVSFTASETSVVDGTEITLSWQTRNARSVTLTANGSPVDVSEQPAKGGSVKVVVDETTDFVLSAKGQGGSPATASITVLVTVVNPEIVSFEASPPMVDEGEEVVLSWVTQHVDTLALTDDAGNEIDISGTGIAEGSVVVTPERATTYNLVATRRGRPTAKNVTVGIKGPPSAQLKVSKSEITWGDSVELEWTTEDAEVVRILRGGTIIYEGTDSTGTIEDQPAVTSFYTLQVSRGEKRNEDSKSVAVRPVVQAFGPNTADPLPVGTMVELAWAVGGATEVTITNDAGKTVTFTVESPDSGTAELEVGPEGTFQLVAKSGELEATATTAVDILPPPQIGLFEALKSVISADEGETVSVTLRWANVERAAELELKANGVPVDISDKNFGADIITLDIDEDTLFELTARNAAGQVVSNAFVRLVPYPTIQSFTARPGYVAQEEAFELAWEAKGFSVEITANGTPVPNVPSHQLTGQIEVIATTTTEYELKVTNEAGDFVTETIEVEVGPVQIVSFTASPDTAAVSDEITLAWVTRGARHLEVRVQGGDTLCSLDPTDWEAIEDGDCMVRFQGAGEYVLELWVMNVHGDEATEQVELVITDGT